MIKIILIVLLFSSVSFAATRDVEKTIIPICGNDLCETSENQDNCYSDCSTVSLSNINSETITWLMNFLVLFVVLILGIMNFHGTEMKEEAKRHVKKIKSRKKKKR